MAYPPFADFVHEPFLRHTPEPPHVVDGFDGRRDILATSHSVETVIL